MENYIFNSKERVEKYLKKLKHPETLKYVKNISNVHKLAIGIIMERLRNNVNNEIINGVKLINSELEALLLSTHKDYNGAYVCVDMSITENKPVIIVLHWF